MWLVGLSRRSGWLARLPGFGEQFDLARRLSDLGCLHGIRRGAARARRLSRALMWRRQRAAIEKSGLFDREWYWKTYPDVAGVGQDALLHYLQFGGREGRSPGPTPQLILRLSGQTPGGRGGCDAKSRATDPRLSQRR